MARKRWILFLIAFSAVGTFTKILLEVHLWKSGAEAVPYPWPYHAISVPLMAFLCFPLLISAFRHARSEKRRAITILSGICIGLFVCFFLLYISVMLFAPDSLRYNVPLFDIQ